MPWLFNTGMYQLTFVWQVYLKWMANFEGYLKH